MLAKCFLCRILQHYFARLEKTKECGHPHILALRFQRVPQSQVTVRVAGSGSRDASALALKHAAREPLLNRARKIGRIES